MKRVFLGLVLVAALSAAPHLAAAERECTDRPECWPEGSAMHTGLLLLEKQRALEKTLAGAHEELVRVVAAAAGGEGSRMVNALKAQQAAWLQYRTQECELVGALTGAGGSWPSTYANRCEVNHAGQRLRRVRAALRCIEKIPADQKAMGQLNCLQQLAPLTNRR